MKQLIVLTAISFVLVNNANAQETCKVSVDALQGTYTGGCKDGKADGEGKASGVDSYEGNFKNGFPDGQGKYTWSNKDVYTGSFKKGALDGRGEIKYFTASGKDSTLKGIWKKNRYFGMYEKPYVINDKTSKTNRIDLGIVKKGENSGSIIITSSQLTQSNAAMNQQTNLIPRLTDITVMDGQFNSKTISDLTKSSVARIQQMLFPFRARLSFSNGEWVDITFYERADYNLDISFL